jgi:hypothetical protein
MNVTSNGFDFTITEAQLRSLAERYDLMDSQPLSVHGECAGLVHRGDTRPDVLTHELATVLYGMQKDFSKSRTTGFVVAELSDIVSDLEPVTEYGYGGHTLTYWRNVSVTR